MKYCAHCKEQIKGSYKLEAVDRPYRNLFFHPECHATIHKEYGEGVDGMLQYLTQNYEMWYNMEEYIEKRRKNERKRKRKARAKGS